MGSLHQAPELIQASFWIIRKIGIHIFVVRNGVGGAGITFDIGFTGGMTDHSCIPYRTYIQ